MFVRPTARLIVLDPDDRVLLFKIEDHDLSDPNDPDRRPIFWITPGGGGENGETFEMAALRELREETGLTCSAVGPEVLEQDILLREQGRDILFRTQFFLIRVETTEVSLLGQNAQELNSYRGCRWWSLSDLDRTGEAVYPEELPAIIRSARAGQPVA